MNRYPTAALAALMALGGAGTAHAATIDLSGGALSIVAGPGEVNDISLHAARPDGPIVGVRVREAQLDLNITPGARSAGCAYEEEFDPGYSPGDPVLSRNVVRCPVPSSASVDLGDGDDDLSPGTLTDEAFPLGVTVEGGAGNDNIFGSLHADTLRGGPGNDELTAWEGNDLLEGGDGDDRLAGWEGNDRLLGQGGNDDMTSGAGDDHLDGGDGDDLLETSLRGTPAGDSSGADTYVGGAGTDSLSYFLTAEPVRVTLDGQPGDGRSGENDNVGADVESVLGGLGNDTLIGSDGPNVLAGGGGDDSIAGGGGDDRLEGDEGADTIHGGDGDDIIRAGSGPDTVDGGAGSDQIASDVACQPGQACVSGPDTVNSRDGQPDTVTCSEGRDGVTADARDNVLATGPLSCENVSVGAPAPGGGLLSAPRSLKLKPFLARGLPVTVACAGRCSVSAKAMVDKRTQRRLRLRSRTVATGRATLASGSGRVTVRLTRKAKRAFKRVRKARLTIAITVVDASGRSRGTVRTTIRR